MIYFLTPSMPIMCCGALPFTEIEFSFQGAKYVLSYVVLCLYQPKSSAEIVDFLLFDLF